MTYALILTMITSFGAISADQSDARLLRSRRRAASRNFQTPGNASNEKPRHGDPGVMFGAPLVLHSQDQDGNPPFIGSVFSVGSFHHRRDGKSAVDLQHSAFLIVEPSHSKIVEPVKLIHPAPRKAGP